MVFSSRIDRWLLLLLAGALAAPFVVAIWLGYQGKHAFALLVASLGGLDLLVVRALVWPVQYVLTPEALEVHSGWIRVRIPYERIERVVAYHLWRDALIPTPSVGFSLRDALCIEYVRRRPTRLVITPEDTDVFLEALAAQHAALRRTGPREVVRVASIPFTL
jgi:hypothetical protein